MTFGSVHFNDCCFAVILHTNYTVIVSRLLLYYADTTLISHLYFLHRNVLFLAAMATLQTLHIFLFTCSGI